MSSVESLDVFVPTESGRLFARRWTPAGVHAPGGAPIVLLHDSLGCVDLWRDFPVLLAQATGRVVIAYDRLGFGRSDPHEGKLGLDFVDREAHEGFQAVRNALDLDGYAAFGHSVGGGMAIACAAADGDACRALITESAQVYAEDRTLEGIRQAKVSFAQPGQLDRLKKYHGEKAAWVLSAWIDTWLSPGFADWTLDAQLNQVRSPALALHGDNDEYGSTDHARRIASLAGAQQVIFADCGHVPHRESPEKVLKTVSDWLADAA
ncbi:alpha/beta fold hydrolase [Achromobacter arsenitoxydans]|uniref:Putative hydrolase-related protein n=1 Tax=Achromobacter arsenitoxydans SY8 TaxID=477184 RepID=H0FCD9_9BURK|nr:alpha/beta hydrolase [Achromobacter arsenitoxydans]EHK64108.1 putative hydrolase-related protein [Achromobacter arsenitoxydans SY8]